MTSYLIQSRFPVDSSSDLWLTTFSSINKASPSFLTSTSSLQKRNNSTLKSPMMHAQIPRNLQAVLSFRRYTHPYNTSRIELTLFNIHSLISRCPVFPTKDSSSQHSLLRFPMFLFRLINNNCAPMK